MTSTTHRINTSSNIGVPHTSKANVSSMMPSMVVKSTDQLLVELQMDHDLVSIKGLKIHGNYIHSIAIR